MTVGREWTADGAKAVRKPLRTHIVLPPLTGDPLLWKERYVGRTAIGGTFYDFAWILFMVVAAICGVFAGLTGNGSEESFHYAMAKGLQSLLALAGMALVIGMGLRLAGSVSREREQLTLESLLTIPHTRQAMLKAKWSGALLRMRRYLLGVVFIFGLGCAVGDIPPVSWVVLPVVMIAHTMFAANLGLFLSVYCRSTTRAYMAFGLVFLTLTAGMWALDYLAENSVTRYVTDVDTIDGVSAAANVLNPIQTWSWLAGNPRGSGIHHDHGWDGWSEGYTVMMVLAVSSYAVAACALWFAARWRFHRETGHA